jgi:hypothetical protein
MARPFCTLPPERFVVSNLVVIRDDFLAENDCSNRVTCWDYEYGVSAGAHGWVAKCLTEPLGRECVAAIPFA